MKLNFFTRTAQDQRDIIQETAARKGLIPIMVEKDFWVSWTLAALFDHPEFSSHLVFKGGTSLSKVFGVIDRFSEDIDLSVSPEFLGTTEASMEQATSRTKRDESMKQLEAACIDKVKDDFLPELERLAQDAIGVNSKGTPWMEFQVDDSTHSPIISFHYPCRFPDGHEYMRRFVKLEFGSLTDQRPVGRHDVRAWVAEEFPAMFNDFRCNLVALEPERTFWEKVTILHAEHFRDRDKPIRDRYSRHYFDMAALARHPIAERALLDHELRQRVVDWKGRFFASRSAHYELAKPGTFALVPESYRVPELQEDYKNMDAMFPHGQPPFEEVLAAIANLEQHINHSTDTAG